MHAIAQQYGAHKARPADKYEFRHGRKRLGVCDDFPGFERCSMWTKTAPNPARRAATTIT